MFCDSNRYLLQSGFSLIVNMGNGAIFVTFVFQFKKEYSVCVCGLLGLASHFAQCVNQFYLALFKWI